MNRLLAVVIALLVLGIMVSRANEILIAISPYEAADPTPVTAAAPAAGAGTGEIETGLAEAELAGDAELTASTPD